ncbi:alginate O-acetyltransferase complex protein AlgI [Clostridium sp. DSM 8431]|uniref:MBOAT family O-acyltransferase n=1 Tax=Clostridium sp. DSM 8431 TaxID=1761781 RepID=UPI0008E5CD86|nr:MBOAT family O-acyltransferase [Clostridium sp. DSM 8431]SFU83994.1 alginate O-acetyltransferase complex protein AlgI [Clostridium sp. DSM 8431]
MLFSSLIFIFYFLPMVLGLYYVSSFSRKLQNIILFVSSLIFYAFGNLEYIIVLVVSICINYIFGILIDKFKENNKIILICALIINLGILFSFKYVNFSFNIINELTGINIEHLNIILPIGISFFTLKAVGYIVDVYKGEVEAKKSIINLGLYISFFPQVIAGPIMNYNDMENQILNRKENFRLFSNGVCRFIVGLSKKVIIADSLAVIADNAFSINSYNGGLPVTLAWLGTIAFSIQIYYDFSGYSDMAIGLGQMFGFKFIENFNYPYTSKSISEFSRKWNISLTEWFKRYVYFPLGGSRIKNEDKIIRNIFVVWILSGIWHGANWTFIIWSLLYFLCVVVERVIDFEEINIKPIFKIIYNIILCESWMGYF